MTVRVQEEDFSLDTEYKALTEGRTDAGAVVAFVGRARDFNLADPNATPVTAMTLEHYPAMTLKQLNAIEREARDRWPLLDCLIIHRYGRLTPGDQIVLVLTVSAHRQAAFEAAQFLMDWLKTKAPFWKREETADGDRWVDARSSDDEAAERWSRDKTDKE